MSDRTLWYTRECEEWLRSTLDQEPRPPKRKLYPSEELWNVFVAFILGRPMAYDVDLKKLEPLPFHVWEFKTISVRAFGFFYRRSTFIVHHGEMKRNVANWGAYEPHIRRVRDYMATIDLDPPPCLTETRLQDVL
ncbi:hypothetical protein [Azospirillum canadense]|uniref:hypothetical protein n=1 Tax=Azospirillum canadense TaxID=403962 RepID=UPI002225D029|nr:hypothetical protein [Azospirillum canadense]MCW2242771.1 hypothetical protein [Azospirillum canadense]